MTAVSLPPPPYRSPLLEGNTLSPIWVRWFAAVWKRLGGSVDKVNAAYVAGTGSAPASTEVVAGPGLEGGGVVGGNVAVSLYAAVTSVALLPTSGNIGDWAFAIDGRKPGEGAGLGTGVPVVRISGVWFSAFSGAAVAA